VAGGLDDMIRRAAVGATPRPVPGEPAARAHFGEVPAQAGEVDGGVLSRDLCLR